MLALDDVKYVPSGYRDRHNTCQSADEVDESTYVLRYMKASYGSLAGDKSGFHWLSYPFHN
jgi:hypothetical protein